MRLSSSSTRGFTLLEVMVSLGILGVALLAIGDLNGGAVRMHSYAKSLTLATQLARGKLLDVQQQLRKDGLSDFSKEYHGDFDEEGHAEIKWKALVIKPEIDVDPQQLLDLASAGLGVGGEGAQASPLAAGGALSGVLSTQLKAMTEAVKQSVREVKLTVTWKGFRGAEETFDLVEHIVVLPNATQTAAANATPMTPGAPNPNGASTLTGQGGLQAIPPGGGLGLPGVVNGIRAPVGIPPGGVIR